MTFIKRLRSPRRDKALLRRTISYGARIPGLREALIALYSYRRRNDPWMRPHPFDQAYGTRTNGTLPPWLFGAEAAASAHANPYAGCQPSCLRRALAAIPDLRGFSFVDLGCGKGRALIVATEWPFARILGIELAPKLVAQARRNAAIIGRKFPRRTPIDIMHGDAVGTSLPDGNLVVFLYHSFDRLSVRRMRDHLLHIASTGRLIYVIYDNPVYGDLIDAEPRFVRWFAANLPVEQNEIAAGPDRDETLIIWRLGGRDTIKARANAPIVTVTEGWKVTLG